MALPTSIDDLTSEELACRAQAGSDESFSELMRRHVAPLIRFISRRVPDDRDAEDLAQETFVRAHRHLDRYDPKYRFSTWLYTIGGRLAVSFRRRVEPTVPMDAVDDDVLFSLDSYDSGWPEEWAQLLPTAEHGGYEVELDWFWYDGLYPPDSIDIHIELQDSGGSVKQDFGEFPNRRSKKIAPSSEEPSTEIWVSLTESLMIVSYEPRSNAGIYVTIFVFLLAIARYVRSGELVLVAAVIFPLFFIGGVFSLLPSN